MRIDVVHLLDGVQRESPHAQELPRWAAYAYRTGRFLKYIIKLVLQTDL